MPSMPPPLLPTMPQLWLPTLSTPPQLLPTPFMLPQLLPTPFMLPQSRPTPMRFPPTPTPTPSPMTTQSPTSTLRSSPMELPMLLDLTPLLFPMDVSNMSSILPMVMMDTSPMSHTRELLSTPRRNHTSQPQLQPTTLKSSLCFVNIYLNYLLIIIQKN